MANSKKTKGCPELAGEESLNKVVGFRIEDLESGKVAPRCDWLMEVWGKWPGDETIEELLAALRND